MAATDLTAARLRELLTYNPDTGLFTWRISRPKARAGDLAGCRNKSLGYVVLRVDGRLCYAHRLAWFYVHGTWPTQAIDHIDGDRANNRIGNLRDVAQAINVQNVRAARRHGSSGELGVHRDSRSNKWRAVVTTSGKQQQFGMFDTPEEAHAAYLKAKRRMHAGCTI